ncbi:MAG: 4-phosphoerythronate dehydrogenase [Bacteroidetes bacterium]|nr:4-phosphoerythronate dehydrogenase [Bacteroidota bacterium]
MRIAADRNIPCISEACHGLGTLRFFDAGDRPGLHGLLSASDVLLCRSTIQVNEALLHDTPVRFVATATSGSDHLDLPWLRGRGIGVATAAGSNARSVAEWWGAAILELHARGHMHIPESTVGIVGVGHVGRQVADVAHALGMRCLYNDPPRALRGESPLPGCGQSFAPLDELLRCSVVSLHVPLTTRGPFPTRGLFGQEMFDRMSRETVFLNAARGGVMTADAVLKRAAQGSFVVLDVFPDEPRVDPALVEAAEIATPHIAGHALDGKLLGTQMVYEALCAWLKVPPTWTHTSCLERYDRGGGGRRIHPAAPVLQADTAAEHADVCSEVLGIVRHVYDIRQDDTALREALSGDAPAAAFNRLRADYPPRREFRAVSVTPDGLSSAAVGMLQALGFRIAAR